MKKGIYLNDSIHGLILLSEYEKRVISSIGFNRLHDVYQNSTVYLTFPTNRTKRFEHSIGTMKLCSDMFFSSVLNAQSEILNEFYAIFQDQYQGIINEIEKNFAIYEQELGGITPSQMPQIQFDKFRHSLVPHNVPEQYQILHLILIQSIRISALLHDIGHPPFSHVVENALKSVYTKWNKIDKEKLKRAIDFCDVMSQYFGAKQKLHERMGNEISDNILKEVIVPITDEESEAYNENLFEVLVLESVKRIFSEKAPFSYLHRIIDSSLDGDRLDYVTRDSINSGMNSGKIDYNRIINDMQLMVMDKAIYFCVPLKAINSVEDFIKRRYNIYKDIVYHHRVIKTDCLLEYSVRDLVNKYLKDSRTEKRNNKVLIPYDISGLWFPLGGGSKVEKANALSQWNDSWLMTILKQIYYTEYYRNMKIQEGSEEYILQQRLSELLRNKRCYYSLIKRSENFKLIDDAVKEQLVQSRDEIDQLLKKISQSSIFAKEKMSKQEEKNALRGATVDITGTLDFIREVLGSIRPSNGFVLSYICKRHKAINTESSEMFTKEIVEVQTKRTFINTKFYDTIVVFKNISIGLDVPIYFYDYTETICTLDDISGISNILQLDSDYLPVFYIYILIKDGDTIVKSKREPLLKDIGKAIGKKLKEKIIEELEERIRQMEE